MGSSVDLTGQKFNLLTVLEKTKQKQGSNYLWKCQCDCGNITLATSPALKSGHKKSCGCFHKKQIQQLGLSKKKDLTNKKFGFLTVIEEVPERKNGRVCWKCLCECGNPTIVDSHSLLGGKVSSCGCSSHSSLGEDKIVSLLSSANMDYVREKSFSDLKGEDYHLLRFDFYVNEEYLIEFDGKQHFINDGGFGSDLINIQKRDQKKNEYCLIHHIPLIRIPYTHLKNLTLEDLIPDTSNFLIKEGE